MLADVRHPGRDLDRAALLRPAGDTGGRTTLRAGGRSELHAGGRAALRTCGRSAREARRDLPAGLARVVPLEHAVDGLEDHPLRCTERADRRRLRESGELRHRCRGVGRKAGGDARRRTAGDAGGGAGGAATFVMSRAVPFGRSGSVASFAP